MAAGRQVEDRQTPVAQEHAGHFDNAAIIRYAMGEQIQGLAESLLAQLRLLHI